MSERGFTLIETLVAITIAAVVLAGLATTVSSQGRSAIFQMGSADVSQNVRASVEFFKREVRMAGLGMGAVPTATLEPVKVEALGAGDVYRVRLRGAYANVQSFGSGAAGTITLDATATLPSPNTFVPGNYVAIESAILGTAEVTTIASWSPGTRTLTVAPALTGIYPAGSPVRQIEDVLYVLDSQGLLMRNNQILADQITGANALTLGYVLNDGTSVANPSATLDALRGATIRMQASGTTSLGMTPQTDMTAEVRIRNLAIATAPEL